MMNTVRVTFLTVNKIITMKTNFSAGTKNHMTYPEQAGD